MPTYGRRNALSLVRPERTIVPTSMAWCRVSIVGSVLLSKAGWLARRCRNEKRDRDSMPAYEPKMLRQLLLADNLPQVFRADDHQARNDRYTDQPFGGMQHP